ncbi:MAG: single-stranded DNA-binding protein [Thermovenabulum sp.]|uniref:single-stranded DNA-binding protein n=1 Tax=Thermovenabulum sp. TaxID=3100335 RepID=UPI003C7E347F
MNKVFLIGRLTKDPELRYTPGSGVAVATFTLAVSRPFLNQKGERDTDFIPIVAWRKLGETCTNNLKKGRLICVVGRLQERKYTDKNGIKRWVTEVIAEEVQFLDRKKENISEANEGEFTEEDIDFDFPEMEEGIDVEF